MKLLRIAFLALLAGCLLTPVAALPVQAAGRASVVGAKKRSKKDKKKTAADTVRKTTPYERLFKGKKVLTARGGGLTLHLVEEKLYLELPDSLLGRGLMITTTIERTGDSGDGIAGQQPVAPYLVHFSRSVADTLLHMKEFSPVVIVDGDAPMREAVEKSHIDPIVGTCSVKARTPDKRAAVIDLTDLFMADRKSLRPIDPKGGNTSGGWVSVTANYKKDRSLLKGVYGGDCVSVVGEFSYETTASLLGLLNAWKDKPQSIVARRSIRVSGEPERRLRLCDRRIGLSAKAVKRFSDREQEAKTDYYACRRSLLDEAGQVRPVVFYVDTLFDANCYAAIERGLLMWNDAFRRIGYNDVVQVRPIPSDRSFNDNALCNNCVRLAGTSASELHAESWVDPRSGEILGSNILVPFNFAASVQRQLLLALSAVDPEARTTQPSPRQIADALTAMIARRAASTLGVMPNYAASAAYPVDSLRSPSFTQRNGLAASITDDVFYNVVAQPGDKERGVKLVADALGPYDYLAVEWLYKPVPEAATPQEETPVLKRLFADKEGDPRYFFAQSASGTYDPRVGAGDLGSDLFRSVSCRLANLKRVAAHGDEWLSGRDGDYKFRVELLSNIVTQVNALSQQLLRYVGGVYMTPVYEGVSQPACAAVPRDVQRRAVRELLDMTADLGWIDDQTISKDVFSQAQACEYLQQRVVRSLTDKLRALDLSVSKSDDPYTAQAMAGDLADYFRQSLRSSKPLTEHARNLQQTLLKTVISASKVQDRAASSAAGASTALTAGLGEIEISLPEQVPADFTPLGIGAEESAAYGYQRPTVVPAFKEHVFYGLLLDLQTMYRQGATSAPAAGTRDFCRYMADRIDRALTIR